MAHCCASVSQTTLALACGASSPTIDMILILGVTISSTRPPARSAFLLNRQSLRQQSYHIEPLDDNTPLLGSGAVQRRFEVVRLLHVERPDYVQRRHLFYHFPVHNSY